MRSAAPQRQRGFTLMESVVALLLLAIVSTVVISLNGNLFLNSSSARQQQQGQQLLQACLDQVLTQRKTLGYDGPFDCSALTATIPDYTLSVTTETTTYCPLQVQCKQLALRFLYQSTPSAPVVLLLAQE